MCQWPLLPCQWSFNRVYVGLFLGSLFIFIDLFYFFFTNIALPNWLLSSASWHWVMSIILQLYFQCYFDYSENFSPLETLESFCSYHRVTCWTLVWNYFEFVDKIEKKKSDMLTVSILPTHEQWIGFHLCRYCLISFTEFYIFSHTHLTHILLYLYLDILQIFQANMKNIVFLTSSSNCLWLKQFIF